MKRKKLSFLKKFAVLTVSIAMLLCSLLPTGVGAETDNTVTLSSSETVYRNDTYYAYVYIDTLKDIASLSVSIHYDSDVVSIVESYNSVSCDLYDSSQKDDTLTYSYIVGGNAPENKTRLFWFRFKVNNDAPFGIHYFDIVIDEAYDNSLNSTDVKGSRYHYNVTEKQTSKSCSAYNTTGLTTGPGEEFELSYYFNSSQIASGSAEIQYDDECFEFVSLSYGSFLDEKTVDYNASLPGSIYISFLGTQYSLGTELCKVKFRTIGNADAKSKINFVVPELYDLTLDNISCSGCSSEIQMTYDMKFDRSIPRMFLSSSFDESTGIVTVTVDLSANSHLGAGDFVLSWDTGLLAFESYEKAFNPSFFNVNDKLTDSGQLKFSIISLTDITSECRVMNVKFKAIQGQNDIITNIGIKGSGLSDSLTNPITLNCLGCVQSIPKYISPVIIGDVNGDDVVDSDDAIYLLFYTLLPDLYPVNQDCDFDGNGEVDSDDAIYLLYYTLLPELYPL